jgi:hypothetical protein
MGRDLERSRPFYFRGCNLTAEYLRAMQVLADGHHPGAIPGNRTSLFLICHCRQAARQLAQTSLQNLTGVGQHHGGLPNHKSKIHLGSWQTSNALALQAS